MLKSWGINKMAATRRIKTAISGGWLLNHETRRRHPYQLDVGESLPDTSALPRPNLLHGNAVTPLTDGDVTTHVSSNSNGQCPRCGSVDRIDPNDGWIYCGECYETVAYRNIGGEAE